jgi:hypothetical protein
MDATLLLTPREDVVYRVILVLEDPSKDFSLAPLRKTGRGEVAGEPSPYNLDERVNGLGL